MNDGFSPLSDVKDLLTEKVQRALLARAKGEVGDEESVDLLGAVAAIVQRFAAEDLLEFIYLPLGREDGFESPSGVDQANRYARFSISGVFIDEEEQEVVTLQGEVVQMTDPAPIIEIQEQDASPD